MPEIKGFWKPGAGCIKLAANLNVVLRCRRSRLQEKKQMIRAPIKLPYLAGSTILSEASGDMHCTGKRGLPNVCAAVVVGACAGDSGSSDLYVFLDVVP